jgi:hypothetical protein
MELVMAAAILVVVLVMVAVVVVMVVVVVRGDFATGCSLLPSYRLCKKDYTTGRRGQGSTNGCRATDESINQQRIKITSNDRVISKY